MIIGELLQAIVVVVIFIMARGALVCIIHALQEFDGEVSHIYEGRSPFIEVISNGIKARFYFPLGRKYMRIGTRVRKKRFSLAMYFDDQAMNIGSLYMSSTPRLWISMFFIAALYILAVSIRKQ